MQTRLNYQIPNGFYNQRVRRERFKREILLTKKYTVTKFTLLHSDKLETFSVRSINDILDKSKTENFKNIISFRNGIVNTLCVFPLCARTKSNYIRLLILYFFFVWQIIKHSNFVLLSKFTPKEISIPPEHFVFRNTWNIWGNHEFVFCNEKTYIFPA